MYNYCDPAMNEFLPFASFQIITFIFLAESTAGMIVVKSWNRVRGTLAGALLGWLVILTMDAVHGVFMQRMVASALVSITLGAGQYGKIRFQRPYSYVMFNLTFWLVIALNFKVSEGSNRIETSIRIPLWRFLQVCIGCFVIIFVSFNVFPNFERLQLRRKAGNVVTELATAVTTLVTVLVDKESEALSICELSSLVTVAAGLKSSTKSAKHEVFLFADSSVRFFRARLWSLLIPKIMELAACVQSLGVLVSDDHLDRGLTDESDDVRGGIELLGTQLSQCLLTVNQMLSTKQTAHTHLFGWMQHAYTKRRLSINSKQKRDSKTRHMQKPEIPNAYFANGASADYRGADEDDDSTGVKISGKYVGLLAALMDEVDLTECLIASLEYKIRQWHKDYCRRASDHVGIATAGTYQQGVNGTKDSGMLAVSGGGVGDGSSEQVDEIRSTSLAAVEHLAGSSDLGDVLSDMVRGRIILK